MNPTTIILAIKSIADAVTEYFRWLQTDEGKRFVAQAMTDRAAWDKFWADAGTGIQRLLSGDLFKVPRVM